ncbi:fimbrial protein [Providencia vermicola]|nr:fimbrial protein [Providencia sp. G1(2023)]MBC8654671.1 fimbrial protein [Providencia vermicola]
MNISLNAKIVTVMSLFLLMQSAYAAIALDRTRVKISGAEHGQMPGFIALTGAESNPGLGIGFKLSSGEEIKINQVSPLIPITQSGKNELKFDTFLKATPDSIANQQIKTGHISAIATFLFEYE